MLYCKRNVHVVYALGSKVVIYCMPKVEASSSYVVAALGTDGPVRSCT